VKYNVHNAAEPTNRTRKALLRLAARGIFVMSATISTRLSARSGCTLKNNSGRAVGKALGMSKSNVYRWAIEEGKKIPRHLDKPSD